MSKADLAILWALSGMGSLAMIAGKVGMYLYGLGAEPPSDPAELAHWTRKRRWLIYSELSAVPAFATVGVTATVYFDLPPVASVPISMVLGALGFGFMLNAAQLLARRKLGMNP